MKLFFCLVLILSAATFSVAQNIHNITRRIKFHTISKDSIDLDLNEDYDLIEDSCSQIIRHAHINLRQRKFFGEFNDVSKLDPSIVLSEGNYTADGLKDGLFTAHYINGNLRSKGHYKNDAYDGHWEAYYDNGKPSLIFEADNGTVRIMEAWDADGKKMIENGKGTYHVNLNLITWKGKLENGEPDGTWHAYKTDDATQTYIVDESFKKGKFQSGNGPAGKYTDASRILLVNPEIFPYTRAEKLHPSIIPCNGIKRKHIVGAQYHNGLASFSMYIGDAVKPVISKYNIKDYDNTITFTGEVSEKGEIMIAKISTTFNQDLAREITWKLRGLPALQPASVDGKPVKQNFTITFVFHTGMYSYTYSFLPIKVN